MRVACSTTMRGMLVSPRQVSREELVDQVAEVFGPGVLQVHLSVLNGDAVQRRSPDRVEAVYVSASGGGGGGERRCR